MTGGQTTISINGEVDPFFRSKRRVRQDDPCSPLLFSFMVDTLATMMDAARAACHIPYRGGMLHLQYGDDTIILIQNNDMDLINLKLLFLCFKIIFGLKINCVKSEVIVMGASMQE